MSYLDVSKIEVCKTLEDNYDMILEEYKSFQFDGEQKNFENFF